MKLFKKKLYALPDLPEEKAFTLYFQQWNKLRRISGKFDNNYILALTAAVFSMMLNLVLIEFWDEFKSLSKVLIFGIVSFVFGAWLFYAFKSFYFTKKQMMYERMIGNIEKEHPDIKKKVKKRTDESSGFMFYRRSLPNFIKITGRAFTLSILWIPIFSLTIFWKDTIEKARGLFMALIMIYVAVTLYILNLLLIKGMKKLF